MSEQQRVFLAVVACMAIFLGWQVFVVKPSPERPKPAASGQAARSATAPESAKPGSAEVLAPSVPLLGGASPVAHAERTFRTKQLEGAWRNGDAALTRLNLLQYNERASGDTPAGPVSLVPPGQEGQARIEWDLGGAPVPTLDFAGPDSTTWLGEGPHGLRLEVEAKPRADSYGVDYVLRAVNRGAAPLPAGATVAMSLTPLGKQEKSFLAPPADQLHALCSVGGALERKEMKNVEKGPWTSGPGAAWAALDRQYFVAALVPNEGSLGVCTVRSTQDRLTVRFSFPTDTVAAGGRWEKHFSLYLGPKRDDRLAAVSPALTDVIDYNIWHIPLGFLARPMVAFLNMLHGWTGSWGVSIMLLTLVVKTLLFPVLYKSTLSMRKMQLLKPELDRIKQQHENDRERQQLEQLKLFREKGVNPLGGCLPMLMQMPVWFALYRTLWSAVDLYQQPFLWLPDLTAKEPFPVLALTLGLLTVIQQKLTPMATDSEQAKMMTYIMPVMLTVFMVALPSGLVLYILVNTVLTILQQLAINRRAVTV
jgi:YidC/Oxa1 family membrane protein insertase